jgi:hypothetical protein
MSSPQPTQSLERSTLPGPSSVPEVVERLRSIEESSSSRDGVACFARLYRAVTEAVGSQLSAAGFVDSGFVEQLDLCFAGLFFSAFATFQADPAATPAAWIPLFESRARRGIAPLQFALAGMNAHINRDLPVALVTTCEQAGIDLGQCPKEHADFERVNTLLDQVEVELKRSYLTGWLAALDRIVHRVGRLDDVIAMWDVAKAREAAWTTGQTLWAIRGEPVLSTAFLDSLDSSVGLASRGLLIPADTRLQRLGRLLSRPS